ncbi:MAG TPA: pyridoxamine 5'-phosphate oxidase family protein [Streptosporangiaceae bacterium]
MFWTAFAGQSPDLGVKGRTLLAEGHGYAYLATVTADSSPRVHPVAPIIGDNGLFVAVAHGSPKLADLRRDPRMALHSTVLPPDDEEFSVRGLAREVTGTAQRSAAATGAAGGAQLSDAMALFEIDLVEVSWARWEHGRPTRRRWNARTPAAP